VKREGGGGLAAPEYASIKYWTKTNNQNFRLVEIWLKVKQQRPTE